MRVYVDNSALNRPFDDQQQPRVWLESAALSFIMSLAEFAEITLLKSPLHLLENSRNTPARRAFVEHCLHLATTPLLKLDETIRQRSINLERAGLKPADSLHLAFAEALDADYFLTCDDRLIKRYSGKLRVLTPAAFIENV